MSLTGNRPIVSDEETSDEINSGTAAGGAPGSAWALGTWTEIEASLSEDMLLVGCFYALSVTSGTATSHLLCIGVGAAASEVEICQVGAYIGTATSTAYGEFHHSFPIGIYVAAGSRVALARRVSSTSVNTPVPSEVRLQWVPVASLRPS